MKLEANASIRQHTRKTTYLIHKSASIHRNPQKYPCNRDRITHKSPFRISEFPNDKRNKHQYHRPRSRPSKHRPARRHHLRNRPRSELHTRHTPSLPPELRPRHQQPRRVPLHKRTLPQRLPLKTLDHATVRRIRFSRRHQQTIQVPPRSRQNFHQSKHRSLHRLRPPNTHGTRLRRHALHR